MSVPGNHHDSNIGNVPQEPSVAADEDAIEPLPAPRVGGEGRPFDYSIATEESLRDLRCEVLVNYLQSQQEEKLWTTGEPGEGVVLRKTKGQYVCSPPQLQTDGSDLLTEVSHLNVMVAMTVNTRVIRLILQQVNQAGLSYVELNRGLRLQVIPEMNKLHACQRNQFAAFITGPQLLVVWEDDPGKLLQRADSIQQALVAMICGQEYLPKAEAVNGSTPDLGGADTSSAENQVDEKPRQYRLIQPMMVACTLILMITALGAGWRLIAIEIFIDHNWMRALFVLTILPQSWLSLFFFQAVVGNIAQLIGTVDQIRQNSKFYSGLPPRRIHRSLGQLPHVTIQMPVYKEGLRSVIEPTIRSIKAAMSTYELQGGTANIFINDDGMRYLSDEEAKERKNFYEENGIGWVARPKHNPKPSVPGEAPFLRRGKFKKASNLNYGLWVSVTVEDRLSRVHRHDTWTQQDENAAYDQILQDVSAASLGETWAEGNIRIGDYILLIDSDTRVPGDCLLDAVSEMESSPQVAIIQYSSGVMNVTNNFFERGITFFTNLVYTQIRYAVANGDVAPFVGHNAIIRWTAVQDVAFYCGLDKREKYWSECTVSEDFEMALRLQNDGYIIRLAAYKGDGFKEGVSLTVYDELTRWEKYAFGCSELIFHPISQWPRHGPFTSLFLKFLCSRIPLPSKITIMAYIGTYYALGSAWITTVLNYFIVGWYNGFFDHYYIDSFRVAFSIIIVFTALGNVALVTFRYRIKENSLGGAAKENIKWIPLLIVFLGGVSLHISQALVSHLLGIDMTWGATAKEVEDVGFFEEIPRVLKRFKWTFIFCIVSAVAMMLLGLGPVPPLWRIGFFTAVWPMAVVIVCHFLLPIVLNPNLMLFTW